MAKENITNKDKHLNNSKLTLIHLKDCIDLDQNCFKGLWDQSQWEAELKHPKSLCIGTFQHSKLIAFACGSRILDELQITAIGVHTKYRKQDLGQKILENLLETAHLRGAEYATLEVSSTNKAAIALYLRCGFKTIGQRPHYYKNGSDALIQRRQLR